jgi:acetyltransferase-like isoleucine patch superfamily enzyme
VRNLFSLVSSFRFAFFRMLGGLRVRISGVRAAKGLLATGIPVIELYPGSNIKIGRNVSLVSCSFSTGLGVNHPVVLRTLASGATISIGDRVGISGGSICAARSIEIGAGSMLGANVTIADTDFHSLYPAFRGENCHPSIRTAAVTIGERVFIGTNSIILKGVSIGSNSVIGAGSVVTHDIPDNCIAAGNPCRVIRTLNPSELGEVEYAEKRIGSVETYESFCLLRDF